MQVKHAILTEQGLIWIDGKGFHKEALTAKCVTLSDLAGAAYKHFISHLWVYPGYGEFEQVKSAEGWNFSPYENRKGLMMGVNVRKQGHRDKDMEIIFPDKTAWWGTDKSRGWIRDADPQEVLITIHYLERALGVTVGASPGRTGWNYLKKIHPEWVEEIHGVDLKACHFTKEAAVDIIWDRRLLPGEGQKLYLHKFDKNAAYPYAASKTCIGVGIPTHKDNGEDAAPMNDKQAVGVWRCSIQYNAASYDASMPTVWKEDKGTRKATEGWLSGPIIRLLRTQGHTVTVHEGWVFPEKHEVMAKWADNLWAIRQSFGVPDRWVNAKCAKLAQRGTKQMVNSMIGMTAFGGFDEDDEMKRPDIRLQVIAKHRELTWHNINKIKQLYGVTPVIVYMDAIYLLSDNPDGRAAFPELVKRETQMGGWKYEGRISMDETHIILEEKLAEADKLEQLNKIGWSK